MRREPDGNVGWPAAVCACVREIARPVGRQAGPSTFLRLALHFLLPVFLRTSPLLFSPTNL